MEDLYAELAALPPETQGNVREYIMSGPVNF